MKDYEVMEVVEIGDAGEVIEGPKPELFDEVSGIEGPPNRGSVQDEDD